MELLDVLQLLCRTLSAADLQSSAAESPLEPCHQVFEREPHPTAPRGKAPPCAHVLAHASSPRCKRAAASHLPACPPPPPPRGAESSGDGRLRLDAADSSADLSYKLKSQLMT
eukprot:6204111-Pleurochrysis_carterae.AAC.1